MAVAILSMLGLIVFMVLVCLLSCLYRIHKRNEKNKKLTLIAQQAGKGDGEAFRQVIFYSWALFFYCRLFLERDVRRSLMVSVELSISAACYPKRVTCVTV